MSELPLLEVERLIRKCGAQRVSEEAGKALAKILEESALAISEKARLFARHAGRKTITKEDIELAFS